MNINEIKDLMAQFDQSSLREFTYRNQTDEISFSKNEAPVVAAPVAAVVPEVSAPVTAQSVETESVSTETAEQVAVELPTATVEAEGDVVESPLVGSAYLAPAPDKPNFVSVGDSVSKGQTLLIVEAMKVMNEIPAPRDGVVTEILVENEEIVDYGKGLVRIK